MSNTPASLRTELFLNTAPEKIYVPETALEAYKTHEDWSEYKDLLFGFKYGDANGDNAVSASDILLLRKYIANYNYDSGASTENIQVGADANGDGIITSSDILTLRKYMANYDYTTGSSSIVLGPNN